MGIDVVADRVVRRDNHVSGAGVSAGIDMALWLTERVHGRRLAEALQLVIEYDPQPPFDASPTKADASTLRLAFRLLVGDRPVRFATEVIGQASAARVRRARRALTGRRPVRQWTCSQPNRSRAWSDALISSPAHRCISMPARQ
jgi:hypothetical protein